MEQDLSILELRNLIASKEAITTQSNNDLAVLGKWSCNYAEAIEEIETEIQTLIKKIKSKD